MNVKTKSGKRFKLMLPLVMAVASLFIFFAIPSQASAATSTKCSDKETPAQCRQAQEDRCKNSNPDRRDDCYKNVAREFQDKPAFSLGDDQGTHQCGNGEGNEVKTKFNFGCLGKSGPSDMTALEDLLYALLRFLSAGVGIVIVIFIVLAGIQYSTSEGNPEATQDAKNKIRNAVIGLIVYIFAFALVQYLVPGGAFKTGSMVAPRSRTIHHIGATR